ncbi:dihydrofolate reductase [Lysinibacillus xylanilyticus]|uniref:dihydrofolate reductase n=1 Tax=Lysinibacillus xylanilyticus TaxID=582475 RepID=UPI0037F5EF8C
MTIKLIVAVDCNFGIGYRNELLFRVKEDLERFKELTTGHFVVMGRKTFESLPNPLPYRTNVIITRDKNYAVKGSGVVIENDIEQLVSHYNNTGQQDKDIWVIGGSEIYKQFAPYVDEIYLTIIHKKAHLVDTHFPIADYKDFSDWDLKDEETFRSEVHDCDVSFKIYSKVVK